MDQIPNNKNSTMRSRLFEYQCTKYSLLYETIVNVPWSDKADSGGYTGILNTEKVYPVFSDSYSGIQIKCADLNRYTFSSMFSNEKV